MYIPMKSFILNDFSRKCIKFINIFYIKLNSNNDNVNISDMGSVGTGYVYRGCW